MNKTKDKIEYSETIMTDIGESYEYLRVIARNNYEIKKLETLKAARSALGKVFFALVGVIVCFFIGILLIFLMTYGFFILLSSWPIAVICSIGILLLLGILLYLLRGFLFYKVVEKTIDKLVSNSL